MTEALPEHLDDVYSFVPGRTVPSVLRAGALGFARLTACSIASRNAAAWMTDFLSAAYYRQNVAARDVDDLRLAFAILITYWYRTAPDRQLHLGDVSAFHRAYGCDRFDGDGPGALDRDQLLAGAERLLGDDFGDGYADDARRAWGIVFETVEARRRYEPMQRMRLATPGPLTPARTPREERLWHAFPPVEMPSAQAAIDALLAPETWPDYASGVARFTPLRVGGLAGQTFEIDLAARASDGQLMFTRGYATITRLVTAGEPAALTSWLAELDAGLSTAGGNTTRALPTGGVPLLGLSLTAHQGHFMGSGDNLIMVYNHGGRAWARGASVWDPTSWHDHQSHRLAGRQAHDTFWGEGNFPRSSMLHQLAQRLAA